MGGTVVNDLGDATGIITGWSRHDLFDEPIKGGITISDFTAAEDSGVVDVEGGDIGPEPQRKYSCRAWECAAAILRGMLAATGFECSSFHRRR